MSELEMKKAKANAFIASKEFGHATWGSLFMMRRSVHMIVNAIKAELASLKQFERFQRDMLPFLESLEKEELRNFMQLEVINKLMTLIETVYALSDALSGNKYDIPRKMAFYDPGVIERFLGRLQKTENPN